MVTINYDYVYHNYILFSDLQVRWNASVRRSSEEDEEDEPQEVSPFSSRCVRCLCCHGNKIYWGDDGTNLKCLEVLTNTGRGCSLTLCCLVLLLCRCSV